MVLIHGEVEYLLSEPISDWRQVEINIDRMVAKTKGFYKKTNTTAISLDEKDFKKVKDEKIWKKLILLKEKGILQDSSHRFLDRVRKVRNTIHDEYAELSEKDLNLFYMASAITSQIYMATIYPTLNISANFLSNAEKIADQLLLKI